MSAATTISADATWAWRRPRNTLGSVRMKLSTKRPAA
jgi:hypothetical protein